MYSDAHAYRFKPGIDPQHLALALYEMWLGAALPGMPPDA